MNNFYELNKNPPKWVVNHIAIKSSTFSKYSIHSPFSNMNKALSLWKYLSKGWRV